MVRWRRGVSSMFFVILTRRCTRIAGPVYLTVYVPAQSVRSRTRCTRKPHTSVLSPEPFRAELIYAHYTKGTYMRPSYLFSSVIMNALILTQSGPKWPDHKNRSVMRRLNWRIVLRPA